MDTFEDINKYLLASPQGRAIWDMFHPRTYTEPKSDHYFSSRIPATNSAFFHLTAVQKSDLKEVQARTLQDCSQLVSAKLLEYDMPQFWVSEQLSQALVQTIPPLSVDWETLKLPFEACTLMIPRGTLFHDDGREIVYISYCRYPDGPGGQSRKMPGTNLRSGARFIILFQLLGKDGVAHGMFWRLQKDICSTAVIKLNELDKLQNFTDFWMESQGLTGASPEDKPVLVKVTRYLFSLILVWTAHPEFTVQGTLLKKVRAKGTSRNTFKEFWSPNTIGFNYRVKRPSNPQGGTHDSPRLHWVSGSFRSQAYGPKLSLRKEIWVEPYLRGVHETESDYRINARPVNTASKSGSPTSILN